MRIDQLAASLAAVSIVCLVAGGCASRSAKGSPFVRPGEPKVHIGPAQKSDKHSLERYIGQVRRLAAEARPVPKTSLLPTIETRDPALAAALLRAVAEPTGPRYRQVAAEYRRLRILDAAHAYYQRALRLEPRDAAALDGLARIWRDWGFANVGLADAHRAVYFAPGSPAARNTLGTLLEALGQPAQARKAYEAAVALDPRAAYAHNNLCHLALVGGRLTEAVASCRAALAIDGGLAAARANLRRAEAALALDDDTATSAAARPAQAPLAPPAARAAHAARAFAPHARGSTDAR
jgi:tetratricopeptide (TPR) repeat protein